MLARKFTWLQRSYVSEIDQFLTELDKKIVVKSNSRIAEEQKYRKVFDLRDNVKVQPMSATLL